MEPYEDKVCRICEHEVKSPSARASDDTITVHCLRCGDYEIVPEAYHRLSWKYNDMKRHILSGRARMSKIETGAIHRFDVEEVQAMVDMQIREKTYGESALSVMRFLATGRPGQDIGLVKSDYAIGYCRDFGEVRYIVDELQAQGLVQVNATIDLYEARLTGRGWQWIEQYITQGAGQQAFIAMSFAPEMKAAEDAICAGVEAAGYEPVLVKYREFEDGIVDKIFAEIRRSRFVIADFTQNKAGVYYEAGFALGLGLRVIGACEKSQLDIGDVSKRLHFDVRHLNMIDWTEGNMAGLTERVERRIRGMFGAGPKATAS